MAKKPTASPDRAKSFVRAAYQDATAGLDRATTRPDPPPTEKRGAYAAGQWPGAPIDRLPPDCPVIPLGIDGKTAFFIDSMGQLVAISAGEWSKKILQHMFATAPNFLQWAWPRFEAKTFAINGLEVDNAMACLMKAAAERGLYSPSDRVRGRGAWSTSRLPGVSGDLLWHAGDRIFRVRGGHLEAAPPGEIDGILYPQRPAGLYPWQEPVPIEDGPAWQLVTSLKSWNWERKVLDPLLVLGWIGCALLGGALDWRPHLYTTGDAGVGKSTLHGVIKAVLGSSLHSTAETTAAGIYQRVKQDSLPVAIDELEATADNRRVKGVMALARLASSGALMYRGGAEHEGVEFQLRNTFFMSGINPPPMEGAEKSRLAILNLGKIDPSSIRTEPKLKADTIGRMLLRQAMDGWPRFHQQLGYWREILRDAGMDSRAQDTWGTLLSMADLFLGPEQMEAFGLPVDDAGRLGQAIFRATASARAEIGRNWTDCLGHLLGSPIDAWSGGEKPTIGGVIEALDDTGDGGLSLKEANKRLRLVSLHIREEREHGLPTGKLQKRLLCVPISATPLLLRLYRETKWSEGVWSTALQQGPREVVIRDRGNGQNVKINGSAIRCLLVDMLAYERWQAAEQEKEGANDDQGS